MAYIPEEKIEEVRAASDIVDVVGDYVRLKKRGTNFVGLCPFHNEKTPSFNVNTALGIFKCFGCGKGGNVYQFLMEVDGVSFPEAVRQLAGQAGIPLPEDEPDEEASAAEAVYHALRFTARFFYEQLTRTEGGRPALAYLEGRGFSPATIKAFGLGYAPEAWDALLQHAEQHHVTPEALFEAGLVISRREGNGFYDRYRGRVIFPIFSHVGKVLGFGGRILAKDTEQPKYINSPETSVYHKSRVLYGLFQAKNRIRRSEEAILVEGYTDVVALHQAGVEQAVAASGTALTEEQVRMLGRYAKRILLLYDADAAGVKATLRSIDLVLAQGLSPYVVALPNGEDPDSYVRDAGAEAFEAYLKQHRQDFVTFRYGLARRRGELDTPEGLVETQQSILQSVAHIDDTLMRESYLRRASDVLDIPDMQLRPVLQAAIDARFRQASRRAERQESRARVEARRSDASSGTRKPSRTKGPRQPAGGPASPAKSSPPRPGVPMGPDAPPPEDPWAGSPPAAGPWPAEEPPAWLLDEAPTYADSSGRGGASGPGRPGVTPPGHASADGGAEPMPQEKILLRLMIEQGAPMIEFVLGHMAEEEFTEGPARTIVQCLLEMYETGAITPGRLLDGTFPAAVQSLAAEVLMTAHQPSENWQRKQNINVPRLNQDPRESASSAMTLLKKIRIDQAIQAHTARIYQASQHGESVRALQEQMMHLHDLRKRILLREFIQP